MLNENPNSRLAAALLPALGESKFFLIDVGASGGISPLWNQFGPALRAHGFDPLIAEVDRLNAAETTGRITYHAAFVTRGEQPVPNRPITATPVKTHSTQTSAARAAKAMQIDYRREHYNAGVPMQHAERTITIDEFCTQNAIGQVDFVKTDTDGYDYDALRGAAHTLQQRGVLGVMTECALHGASPDANTFSNVDRFLSGMGFAFLI